MIHRTKRDRNYTVLPNTIYAHHQLSWQAMGLLSYLLSKPDDWQVSPRALLKVTEDTAKKTGINGIYTILNELKTAGFCSMKRLANGKTVYAIYDEPQAHNPNEEKPHQAKPHHEKPNEANDDVLLSNIDKQSTDINKIPLNPQRGNKGKPWILPKGINTQAWREFEEHRKEKRKPLSNLARTKACQILINKPSAQQQAIVDQTIVNNWTGLFEVRSQVIHPSSSKQSMNNLPTSYQPSPTAHREVAWLNDAIAIGGVQHA